MPKSMPRNYSIIAPVYDQLFHRPLSEGHHKVGSLLEEVLSPKARVLEVGVGSGLTFGHLPAEVDYVGIDINERMLTVARKKVKLHPGKKIELQVMDVQKMNFENESFDMVIAPSVITAIESPIIGIQEMMRVTKTGGYLVIIAHLENRASPGSRSLRLFNWLTKKFVGFRMDIDSNIFDQFKELELIEKAAVNRVLGFPLSTFLVFKKIRLSVH